MALPNRNAWLPLLLAIAGIGAFNDQLQAQDERWNAAGRAANRAGRHYQAVEYFARHLSDHPRCSVAINNQGWSYFLAGDYDRAVAHYSLALEYGNFSEAIEPPPREMQLACRLNRARAYARLQQCDQALEDCNYVKQMMPSSPDSYLQCAAIYLIQKRGELAAKEAESYLLHFKTNNKDTQYLTIYGCLGYKQCGSDEKASQLAKRLQKTLRGRSWPIPILEFLGGDLPGRALHQLATDNDKMTEAQLVLGAVGALAGKTEEARACFEWASLYGSKKLLDVDLAAVHLDRGLFVPLQKSGPESAGRVAGGLSSTQSGPDSKAAMSSLSRDLTLATKAVTEGNRGAAIDVLSRAVECFPDASDAYILRGSLRLSGEEYSEAIEDYSTALEIREMETAVIYRTLSEKDAAALAGRAHAHFQVGDYRKAIDDFTAVLSMGQGDVATYSCRAKSHHRIGNLELAIRDFSEAIRLEPNEARNFVNRGVALRDSDKLGEAISDFAEAIRIAPEDAEATVHRAKVLYRLQEYLKSSEDFERALLLSPGNADFNANAAWFRATCPDAMHRDGPRAVDLATEACNTGKWKVEYVDTLAAAYAETGDFDKAVTWQREVVGLLAAEGKPTIAAEARLALYKQKKPYREYPLTETVELQLPTFSVTTEGEAP